MELAKYSLPNMSERLFQTSRSTDSHPTIPGRPQSECNCTVDEPINTNPHFLAEDLSTSSDMALEDNALYEPFLLEDALMEPPDLQGLTKFTFQTLHVTDTDCSESIVCHYRILDSILLVAGNAFAQKRGHVLAIIRFGDDSAAIVPYGSLCNFKSHSAFLISGHSTQSNTLEGTHPNTSIRFWTSVASDVDHVTFVEVPCLSVICFPQMGFFHTRARIIDMQLPVIQCVQSYSCAISHHFRNLKQLHLFGDKKACKALRLQLNGTLSPESPIKTNSITSLDDHHLTGDDDLFCKFKADFEIFIFDVLDLGACFGKAELQCKKLSFSKLSFGIYDIQVLVSKTFFLKNLAGMQLISCSIGPDGASVVSKMLSSDLHHLEYLSLTGNPLNDEGCSYICDSLTHNTSLTKLSLGDVNASSSTAHNLSRLLLNNCFIQILSLYENPVEEDGFFSLFDALQTNSCLTNLVLSDCPKFDTICAAKLINLLRLNVQLTEVKVSGNPIGREMDQEISLMYVHSNHMQHLPPCSILVHVCGLLL